MPAIVDSYSESNKDDNNGLSSVDLQGQSQSFANAASIPLSSAKFYLAKVGSPVGTAVAKLYALTGTHGTDAKPTGAALATSATYNVASLGGANALVEFTFDGAYTMAASTNYCIAVEYGGGDGSNRVIVGIDGSSPSHGGNPATLSGGTWTGTAVHDACFYVYGSTPGGGNMLLIF